MTNCFLTELARKDIKAIGRYTFLKWGVRQSNSYLRQLQRRIAQLAERPLSGSRRPDIGSEFRSALAGSHIIVYREVEGGIEIARVLHRRMDVQSRMTRES